MSTLEKQFFRVDLTGAIKPSQFIDEALGLGGRRWCHGDNVFYLTENYDAFLYQLAKFKNERFQSEGFPNVSVWFNEDPLMWVIENKQ